MNAEAPAPSSSRIGSGTGLIVALLIVASIMTALMLLARHRALRLVHPERVAINRTPDALGITHWEGVTFTTPDGLRLSGWFVPPAPAANGATMMLLHGFGSNRTKKLPLAARLVAEGYGVLLYDTRNLGESEGTVSTLGLTEPLDVRGALDYLAARPEVNMQRIGIVGESLGGVIALRAAAAMPELRVVVAEAAYASLEENIRDGIRRMTGLPAFPFAPLVMWFAERAAEGSVSQVRPVDEIGQIAPRPVLLLHGENDPLIAASNSERLYAAAGEPRQLHIFAKAAHGRFMETHPVEYIEWVIPFLKRTLPVKTQTEHGTE